MRVPGTEMSQSQCLEGSAKKSAVGFRIRRSHHNGLFRMRVPHVGIYMDSRPNFVDPHTGNNIFYSRARILS
jgi:hypothetical protein